MKPRIRQSKCIDCLSCLDECPVGAIKISKKSGKPYISQSECIDCGNCIDICPVKAIRRKK